MIWSLFSQLNFGKILERKEGEVLPPTPFPERSDSFHLCHPVKLGEMTLWEPKESNLKLIVTEYLNHTN